MSWYGPALDEEQREVMAMVDGLCADLGPLDPDRPELTDQARAAIVEAGIWTLSAPQEQSGVDLATTLLVLERLGRYWPALGWASAQVQAALSILTDATLVDLGSDLAAGTAGVAIVDGGSPHVDLEETDGLWSGHIDRIDTATAGAPVIVLNGPSNALVFPEAVLRFEPVRTTGLTGSQPQSVTVESASPTSVDIDVRPALTLLHLGAGAIAAGIAGAASDQARQYAADRTQFGGPLTDIPTVRQSLMEQTSSVTRAITSVMSADAASQSAVSAAFEGAVETAVDVAGMALQSHGGYGYLDEYPMGRFLRDSVSLRAASDSTNSTRQSARRLVGLPETVLKES